MLEVGLRLVGWGGYPAWIREAGREADGSTLCLVEPAAAEPYFFANPSRSGYPAEAALRMPKPKDTLRIFLIGESAAKGYPQPRNLSVSTFLQEMLAAALPGKNVEVINLGTVAVASLPLVYQVRDALRFSPDLFVFYVGNNEFFGAYGTASLNAGGSLPLRALHLLRTLRGSALVQAVGSWFYRKTEEKGSLMEAMLGRSFIPADSPLRTAAARNLRGNLTLMLREVARAGVPALVCTTASNEAGLAPLGKDDVSGLGVKEVDNLSLRIDQAVEALRRGEFARSADLLTQAKTMAPRHARVRFLLGQALASQGQRTAAKTAFLEARDLDPMPWRPTSATEEAIRLAAAESRTPLCDVAEIFRSRCAEGAAGWDLLDDHVHLSLAGQALAARSMADSAAPLLGGKTAATDALPSEEVWIQRMGKNFYDDYGVNYQMKLLFEIPFMRESNPEAWNRFRQATQAAEEKMSPPVLAAVSAWKTTKAHQGDFRPIAAMVARALQGEGRTAEALELYRIAKQQVASYTSWYLEYVYSYLLGRRKVWGQWDAEDQSLAEKAIAQGRFLLEHGPGKGKASGLGGLVLVLSGLHELCGNMEAAIPLLQGLRPKMSGEDLVATDQALVLAYLHTGRRKQALELAEDGVLRGGRFLGTYLRLLQEIQSRGEASPR